MRIFPVPFALCHCHLLHSAPIDIVSGELEKRLSLSCPQTEELQPTETGNHQDKEDRDQ